MLCYNEQEVFVTDCILGLPWQLSIPSGRHISVFFTCHLCFSPGMITLLCTTCWTIKWVSGIAAPSHPPLWKTSKVMWPWWCSVQILRTAKRDLSSPMRDANVSHLLKWITERRSGFWVEDERHLSSFIGPESNLTVKRRVMLLVNSYLIDVLSLCWFSYFLTNQSQVSAGGEVIRSLMSTVGHQILVRNSSVSRYRQDINSLEKPLPS